MKPEPNQTGTKKKIVKSKPEPNQTETKIVKSKPGPNQTEKTRQIDTRTKSDRKKPSN